jgi:hypothetical protein
VNTVPTSFSADYVCPVKDHRVAAGPSREQSEVPACSGHLAIIHRNASKTCSGNCVCTKFYEVR